jgi:4'-phosphopantetheinyl transferase
MRPNVCVQDSDVLISFQAVERLTRTARQGRSRLELNAVHLWGIQLDGSPHCVKRCEQWLDEEEQRRSMRLVREEDRRHYVLAHGGLRAVLSRYLGIDPGLLTICRSEAGKPFLTGTLHGQPQISFNMSHAYGRALIAVSKEQEVGVDLERIRSDVEVATLSRRYFTSSEHAAVMRSPREQRPKVFFRYWVAKEAVLKAQGIGLQALGQCEILMAADGEGKDVLVQAGSPLKNNWTVRLLTCDEGWEAAVAAQSLNRLRGLTVD